MTQERLTVVPCTLAEANAFVERLHRHHGPRIGHIFSLAVMDSTGRGRGAAIVGRPVNRSLDNGWTLEVNRLVTDGCPNACSSLYGTAWRLAKTFGYRRLITYILDSEPGISLRAAGWVKDAIVKGVPWNNATRVRNDAHPLCDKQRWRAGQPFVPGEAKRPCLLAGLPPAEEDLPLFTTKEG